MPQRFVPYTFHQVVEQQYKDMVKCLEKQKHRDAQVLTTEALFNTRTKQQMDARMLITGRTVRVYAGPKLLMTVGQCQIESGTAKVCFALKENDSNGVVAHFIEVTPEMDLWVEHS